METWIVYTFLCMYQIPCQPFKDEAIGFQGWVKFSSEQECNDYKQELLKFKDRGYLTGDLWVGECIRDGTQF